MDSLPSGFLERCFLLGNDFVLERPESVCVREILVFSEQVTDDGAFVELEIKEGDLGRDLLATKEPAFQAVAERRGGFLVLIEFDPFTLLLWARHGQEFGALMVDIFSLHRFPDRGNQVAERKTALDGQLGDAKRVGNVHDTATFLGEAGKGFKLGHWIGRETGTILQNGDFNGGGVIALVDDGARQRVNLACFLGDDLCGGQAALARDHFKCACVSVCPYNEGHDNAARADARQDVRDVRRFCAMAHVNRCGFKFLQVDMFELHGFSPF